MKWECTKCGACCRMAAKILQGVDFPYSFDENGTCEKYHPKKGCTIYDDRPAECRVDVIGAVYEARLGIKEAEYYAMTAVQCNKLMDELGIKKSFRIK